MRDLEDTALEWNPMQRHGVNHTGVNGLEDKGDSTLAHFNTKLSELETRFLLSSSTIVSFNE